MTVTPPKPTARAEKISLFKYARAFRRDILSAQPAKLYRAWMAEFKTPFFRSFLINDPKLIAEVLRHNPDEFPKSDRIREGLKPILGNSVFLTNGEVWKRQRRIIDPAFEGGRLRDTFGAMNAACEDAVARMLKMAPKEVEIEEVASFVAADIIFRTLFSIPITHRTAAEVFTQFRAYQRNQPILNLAAFVPLPRWMPRFHRRNTKKTARAIRLLIGDLVAQRAGEIAAGTAPDDLATKIMTTRDPQTGAKFSAEEMVDQVAIFFLAGHETSASALAWALYLLAIDPAMQNRVAEEVAQVIPERDITFSDIGKLRLTRDVFREALRLYPPVPMMVREAACPQEFRNRDVPTGAQIVLSPWHLHRHERLWERPDEFDPDRFRTENGKTCLREAYMPFSAGPRVCTGAGFAMIEGPLLLASFVRALKFSPGAGHIPVPVAHLTVRAKDGIWLQITPR
ncbi:cytochrome P450 [Falsihalocynthiibacter arcticus]|uniref:Cytochrome n=1 Tax=Falsihalocynthiibacter arcticus TaxID=1579316 RepID=A0A126V2K6_9RHOB|nr:cytochrome P450 [Falsihalocynthiibacter arcticus]AML52554.1 cytochrome [Falsihalocynthiibacter arcticus]